MSTRHHRDIPPHLLEQAWEIYSEFTYKRNKCIPGPADKMHFLGGVGAVIGLLIGTLDVGIPEGTPTSHVMAQLINVEIPRYQHEIAALVEAATRMQ